MMRAARSRLYLRRAAWLGLRALLTFAYLDAEPVRRAIGLRQQLDPFALAGPPVGDAQPTDGVPAPTRSEGRLKADGEPSGRRRAG